MASTATDKQTILIVAHGHPETNTGGGEFAAYNSFKEIGEATRASTRTSWRARRAEAATAAPRSPFARGRARSSGTPRCADYFSFSQPNKHIVWSHFRDFLRNLQPDVVHFHHYLHLGIELLREVKRANPDTRLVVTLHDYWALCHNNGQMVKTGTRELCNRSAPDDCHRCFPAVRAHRLLPARALHQVALRARRPVHLAERVPAPALHRLGAAGGQDRDARERPGAGGAAAPARARRGTAAQSTSASSARSTPSRAFSPARGGGEAAAEDARRFRLDLHGANLEMQEPEFQEEIVELLEAGRATRALLRPVPARRSCAA